MELFDVNTRMNSIDLIVVVAGVVFALCFFPYGEHHHSVSFRGLEVVFVVVECAAVFLPLKQCDSAIAATTKTRWENMEFKAKT